MFTSNVYITYSNVKFGAHITCQVATWLNDIFKVFNSTNNTHLFLFQFCIFEISLTPPLTVLHYYKYPVKWSVMYMCIRGVDFVFVSPMCPLDFVPVPTVLLFFPFSVSILYFRSSDCLELEDKGFKILINSKCDTNYIW
jgi:hypothetical protein